LARPIRRLLLRPHARRSLFLFAAAMTSRSVDAAASGAFEKKRRHWRRSFSVFRRSPDQLLM
jgi:hypothetical protein